jgi:uncharacterized RDD family membrane protein YckC
MSEKVQGVYYSLKDYAGLGRRLLILGIDAGVIIAALLVALLAYGLAPDGLLSSIHFYAGGYVVFLAFYLAVLGRSDLGTLGYLLTSVRVVNLQGDRPSLTCMLFRSSFVVLGPFNALLDIIWLGGDSNRQSIRDKLTGTYVVRRKAKPSGVGVQNYVMITFGYWNFLVREVSRVSSREHR